MADAEDIVFVQANLPTSAEGEGWNSQKISQLLDQGDGMIVERVLMTYWSKKAADTAHLVTISESGSTRELGTIYNNAMTMSSVWENRALRREQGIGAASYYPRGANRRITRI